MGWNPSGRFAGINAVEVRRLMPLVRRVATEQREFTVDDVTLEADSRHGAGGVTFTDPRAWGLVMREAHRRGLIRPTSKFTASTLPTCHSTPRRVWRGVVAA